MRLEPPVLGIVTDPLGTPAVELLEGYGAAVRDPVDRVTGELPVPGIDPLGGTVVEFSAVYGGRDEVGYGLTDGLGGEVDADIPELSDPGIVADPLGPPVVVFALGYGGTDEEKSGVPKEDVVDDDSGRSLELPVPGILVLGNADSVALVPVGKGGDDAWVVTVTLGRDETPVPDEDPRVMELVCPGGSEIVDEKLLVGPVLVVLEAG